MNQENNNYNNISFQDASQPKKGLFKSKRNIITETFEFSPEKKLMGIILLFINSLLFISMFLVSIVNPFYYIHIFTVNILLGDIGSIAFYSLVYVFALTKLMGVKFEKPSWFKLNKTSVFILIATIATLSMSITIMTNNNLHKFSGIDGLREWIKDDFWNIKFTEVITNKPWVTGFEDKWLHFDKMFSFQYYGILPILIFMYPMAGSFTEAIVPLLIGIILLFISISYIAFGSWKALFVKSYQQSLTQAKKVKGKYLVEKTKSQSPEQNDKLYKEVPETDQIPMIKPSAKKAPVIGKGMLSDSILNKEYKQEVVKTYNERGMTWHEKEMDDINKGNFDDSKYSKYGKEYTNDSSNQPTMDSNELDSMFGMANKNTINPVGNQTPNNNIPTNNISNPINNIPNPINNIPNPGNNISHPINNIPNPGNNISHPINNISYPINNIPNPINNISNPINNIPNPINNIPNLGNNISHPINKISNPGNNISHPKGNDSNINNSSIANEFLFEDEGPVRMSTTRINLNETLDLSSNNLKRDNTQETELSIISEIESNNITPREEEEQLFQKDVTQTNKYGQMLNKATLTPFTLDPKQRVEETSWKSYTQDIFASNEQAKRFIHNDEYFNKEIIDTAVLSSEEFSVMEKKPPHNESPIIESFEDTYEIRTENLVDTTTEIILNEKEVKKVKDFDPKPITHRTSELPIQGGKPNPINHQFEDDQPKNIEQVVKPVKKCVSYKIPSPKILATIDHTNAKARELKLRVEVEQKQAILNGLFESFNVDAKVSGYRIGPRLINFEIEIGYAVKITKITNLEDNIKLALAAASIRIQAPIPGKSVVGIEIPHGNNEIVGMKDVLKEVDINLNEPTRKLNIALGKDSEGRPIVFDLKKAPHLLVAGATGSGKSVAINVMLISLLLQFKPSELKMILVDPKMVEFTSYGRMPHLLAPIVTDSKKAAGVLNRAVQEMENRYLFMSQNGSRNIDELNEKMVASGKPKIPYLVIIIDELADLMIVAKKDVEESIMRLTQKARASGIHLIIATQKPSTEVITGVIKANIPSRIAFTVSSGYDSKTILDQTGAEKLIGQGDMLISLYGSNVYRGQSSYVSNQEVENITEFSSQQCEPVFDEEFINAKMKSDSLTDAGIFEEDDPDFQEAKRLIVESRKASVSFLQRRMRIGYNKAAGLMDALEHYSVVGPSNGSKSREIYDDL